ncbi:MAG: ABC-2 family transporter protein [Planctomycetota bacterium]|nr:ABC-2 family transporter protein [Planctomycetota bacterium]MDA1140090.1 ABC-2 family transporter protein [Planctomycetota bacterium]
MFLTRYLRIYFAMARNCLVREMSFRGHFLITVASETLWFALQIVFFEVIFMNNDGKPIAGWTKYEVLFLLGTQHLITQFFELVFFTNCMDISDQIRTGGLDFILTKPVNSQFLLSLRKLNFNSVANIPVALAILGYAGYKLGVHLTFSNLLVYIALVGCGVLILYNTLFIMALSAFWVVRNQSLFELWFPVRNFASYPIDMYPPSFKFVLTFVFPILAVTNFPAMALMPLTSEMNRSVFNPTHAWFVAGWAIGMLVVGHFIFRFALHHYRSASS